ncbi:class I SAM-dependent methyltransferase [Chloroflexota bacterium]
MRIAGKISGVLMSAIAKNGSLVQLILKLLLRLDNFSYRNISRFAVMAEGGIHPKHRLMNYHRFFVDNVSPQDAVLDIGCGNGFLSYDIAGKAKSVTAVDLSPTNIKLAKKDFNKENIEYICGDACQIEFTDKFDVIILSNVLEHIEDGHKFLLMINKLADRFLVRVPLIDREWLTYYKRELGVEYRLDATHRIEYTLATFQEELGRAGMQIETVSTQFGEIWAVVGKTT